MLYRKNLLTGPMSLAATWVLAWCSFFMKGMVLCVAMIGLNFAWAQDRGRELPAGNAVECWVSEFREIALTTHDVGERERKALSWLKRYGQQCTQEQLLMLATNRPSWLGHADTARVAGAIDRELERRYLAGRGNVENLFDSPAARPAETQTITTPEALAPVVPGTQGSTAPAAVVVQQPAPSN